MTLGPSNIEMKGNSETQIDDQSFAAKKEQADRAGECEPKSKADVGRDEENKEAEEDSEKGMKEDNESEEK